MFCAGVSGVWGGGGREFGEIAEVLAAAAGSLARAAEGGFEGAYEGLRGREGILEGGAAGLFI